MLPLISVIIPIYNAENYIQECLNSILHQNYDNFEIILIDDASTDNSLSLIKSLYSHLKNVTVLHLDVNSGAGLARNKGLKYATGKYVTFIDSDDFILPEYFSRMYLLAEKYKADVVNMGSKIWSLNASNVWEYVRTINIVNKNTLLCPDPKIRLLYMCKKQLISNACGKLYDHNFLKKFDLHYESLLVDDVLFHFNVLYYCNTYVLSADNLYCIREKKNSITRGTSIEKVRVMLKQSIEIMEYVNSYLHSMQQIREDKILIEQIYTFFMEIYFDYLFVKNCNGLPKNEIYKILDEVLEEEFNSKFHFVKYFLGSYLQNVYKIK